MRQINIKTMVNEAKLSTFHYRILLVCALIIAFDGYDLTVSGVALPWIMKEMAINATYAGVLISSALVGMMVGNIVFGTVADKIGRQKIIVLCILLCSVFTAAAGFCKEPVSFSAARFIAGLGLGGAMPNVVSLMTEYSPVRIRNALVTSVFSGFSLGGLLAAGLGKGLIESYGWQSVFIAAAAPVLLIPMIWKSTPESIPFLIRGGRIDELKKIASRVDGQYRPNSDDRFVENHLEAASEAPVRQLFQQERGLSTLMFWMACFICLFTVYGLSSWLIKLMAGAGYSNASALTFMVVMNLGGVCGVLIGGVLADRLGIKCVLMGMFVLAAVSIILLGVRAPTILVYVWIAIAGACTIGTQNLINAYAGQFYPIHIRTTGVGWVLGVGRAGAILSPVAIGMLVHMGLSREQYFLAIGIPSFAAAIAITLIDNIRSDLPAPDGNANLSDERAVVRAQT
ncbi:MFS transporter [Trinickia mobilis]|uniref:MFS transporter n=1 Tax=Trinickia mobilis TaxID=2816356 RepID=UPI001A8E806A|nr:MFS transporter [Trinickia mobilis]